ncbi:hypothetical protein BMR11_00015 [Methylococcaceae bacterium CS5]|nr:hypothetical protein BMR11_00015 [Methylococcaceae bacterium CS5]
MTAIIFLDTGHAGGHIEIVDIKLETAGAPDKVTAIISLDTGHAGATALEKRVNGKYWHGRMLSAYALRDV